MRFVLRILSWTLALALAAALGFAIVVLRDSRPLVPQDRALTAAEIAWAKRWLKAARPRGIEDGEQVELSLSESEANVLGSYWIDKLGPGRIAIELAHNRARIAASLGLPWDPANSFVNLDLTLAATDGLPRIEQARLGGISVPASLAQNLADRTTAALYEANVLRSVALEPDRMRVTYEWHRHALESIGSGLVPPDERARMLVFQDLLDRYGAARPRGHSIPLPDLLSRLLVEGPSPSGGGKNEATAENRAAILALAAYVNGRTIRDPTEVPAKGAPVAFRTVTLRGRPDLAQHFMVSAAVSSEGGDALSDLLGLLKEAQDSNGGSGFSFPDLTADRAGTRFGQLATGNREGALKMQTFARRGLVEDDIMPSIEGLPEGLDKTQFAAAYRNATSPAYRALAERIERRIDRLQIHRDGGG
jgi:hypothetical protein